ncbi:MAG: amidohydrolase family protein [Ignavibacteria bacterium]
MLVYKTSKLLVFLLIIASDFILTREKILVPALSVTDSSASVPDAVYFNGSIITMDPAHPSAEAVALKSDTIMSVGTNEEILDLAIPGGGTKIIDLNGLTMLPGFNDSHSHWFSWRQHICSVSNDTTYPSLEEIMEMLSSNGWTSITELNFGRPDFAPEHLNIALDLDRRGELSVRLNGFWGTLDDGSLIHVLADSMRTPGKIYSERIWARGVKMYVDDPFGTADILSQEETTQLVQLAHSSGWQIAAHAVNESAVEKILTAYEEALGAESNENYRYRIEHAVKVSDDQLDRMKQKGIIASFQLMGPPDWPDQFTFQTYISNTHPEWCLRWKDFVDAESEGLHITGSTDAPFNDTPCDYSPFRVIYQAVARKGYLNRDQADWELAQRLTIEDCLKLLTADGAYATFEEQKKGSITTGKWADLVIVSDNPLNISVPEELLDIKILLTMVGGQIEYCDNSLEDLCAQNKTFIVDSAFVTASKFLESQTPDLAFDNNAGTNWSSGDFAPQWIQIKFPEERKISGVNLLIDQWPAGETTHQIWGKGDQQDDQFELIYQFRQYTQIDQILNYTATDSLKPYQYFRITTTESPSWISWKEIEFIYPGTTETVSRHSEIQGTYELMQNYPNPFNPLTNFVFRIADFGLVSLKIYDLLGNEIATIVNEELEPGQYHFRFSAASIDSPQSHFPLASGVYFYRLKAGRFVSTKKFVLMK